MLSHSQEAVGGSTGLAGLSLLCPHGVVPNPGAGGGASPAHKTSARSGTDGK